MGADESMRVHMSDVTINQLNAFVDLFSHNLLIMILCITKRLLIFSGVEKKAIFYDLFANDTRLRLEEFWPNFFLIVPPPLCTKTLTEWKRKKADWRVELQLMFLTAEFSCN